MKIQPSIGKDAAMNRGFALLVTLVLMVLLLVLAVGLLSLSSVTLRTASAGSAEAEAKQNARLAMQLAINQLQSLSGQDTRVTASSRMLSDTNVVATGVWRSWEGSDHDSTGKPIPPDYNSKTQAGDPSEEIAGSSDGRFLGWLTSTAANVTPDISDIPNVTNTAATGSVKLVSEGSVEPSDDRKVFMVPTMMKDSKGAIAWWTSGDNSKAMINTDPSGEPTTTVEWQQRVRGNGRADAEYFDLEEIDALKENSIVASTGGLNLVDENAELRKFHDLTAYSRGLLTNTANGGWRRDISLMSEKYNSLPNSNLPSFTITPGVEHKMMKINPNSPSGGQLLYPWADYRQVGNRSSAWQWVPPICSWHALVDFTQSYRELNTSNSSKTGMKEYVAGLGRGSRVPFVDETRRAPQIARIQWIYSIGSRQSSVPGRFNPGILLTPIVTFWNPYNVELSISNCTIAIRETTPITFNLKVGNTSLPEVSLRDISKQGNGNNARFNLKINSPITLAPGASRIYSTADSTPEINTAASNVVLEPGYTPGGGILYTYVDKRTGTPVEYQGGATERFTVEKISYDAQTAKDGSDYVGIYYDITYGGVSGVSAARMDYAANELGAGVIEELYPPLTNSISAILVTINVNSGGAGSIRSRPFASALFGFRMASPLSRDPNLKHLISKGMLQANPLTFYAEVGYGDHNNAVTSMAGTGVYHPVNAPYDFAFQELNGWNDTQAAPQWEASSGSTYIVSGLTPSDGLTRCVMAELPTRPIQSLADLQHFDARNNNPIPPFQFNLIGNGSAHPIFAPTQTSVTSSYNNGMCNDDTFMLNHLLFDDWFVSSIAPDLNDFRSSESRDIEQVYEDHLNGTEPLPNRFYLPAQGSASLGVSGAVTAAMSTTADSDTGKYSYETIASKLVVDGMFNINCVSLEAWKSVLRQSRDMQVPYLSPNGGTTTDSDSTFGYPRTSIAGDKSSDSGSSDSGSTFPDAAEFAGYRALTEEQIDELAEQIVSEIKKRGPFLSLSEFANRQLSGDKDLAIASTIQKALDNLADMGSSSKNPYAAIQAIATEITSQPPGNTDYKFEEAAFGSSAFGVPGWIRQADILKPLAPIISARDDTFTIRAYGDSRDKNDSTKILAKAWCEVVVQRGSEYVDSSDAAGVAPFSPLMTSEANKRFGRRYEIVSFRWIREEEI
ncbi:MAG: hypothetical protein ACSHX9_10710 [Luteolibacter sp.]